MAKRLRIIDDSAHGPAFNMAADLYLLDLCAAEPAVFLRFYHWEPPAISIGYMQDPSTLLNMPALEQAGVWWIRRSTGGRAVLHQKDLTYCVTFSRDLIEMGRTIHQTYELLSRCFMQGLLECGIACSPHDSPIDSRTARREIKLPCFLAPNRREIMVDGRKLIGSAQKRTSKGVLQHGSIPLTGAFRNLPQLENISPAEQAAHREMLNAKCTCIREIAPSVTRDHLVACLGKGFGAVLNLDPVEGPWSAGEQEEIAACARSAAFREQWLS
ncbi:MAG: hypothetical protein GF418_03705 [Chitinivibrionales bacterium]|nr:hypothetical protein [Chitinivibrionales bacterium]MBD3394710.1 hypothetical protein [Chitinivibrionales bacterium]